MLVGALPGETLPVLRALKEARPAHRGRLRLIEGELAGAPVGVLTCGVGLARAQRRTAEALARWEASAVVSFGTCGALVEGLGVGDLVLGSAGEGAEGAPAPRWEGSPQAGLPGGRVATVGRVVDDPARRSALAAAGFAVCDMEAAGVAAAAGARVFFALKVVSDLAGHDAAFARWGRLPDPAAWLRFQRRAARLIQSSLLPSLRRLIADCGGNR